MVSEPAVSALVISSVYAPLSPMKTALVEFGVVTTLLLPSVQSFAVVQSAPGAPAQCVAESNWKLKSLTVCVDAPLPVAAEKPT